MSETKAIESDDEVDASRAPLMDHLLELRSRLIRCVLALIVGCVVCIPFLRHIIQGLMWPFERAMVKYNAAQSKSGFPEIDLGLKRFSSNSKSRCLAALFWPFRFLLIKYTAL